MASNDFVISEDLIVLGASNFSGTIQGTIGSSYALLNEAATAINPTVAPNRLLLGTGISAVDNEGAGALHLIADDTTILSLSLTNVQATVTNVFEVNGAFFVDGNADTIQMRIDAHSTQTSLLFRIRDSSSATIFTIDNGGFVALGGLNYIQFQVAGPFSSGGGSNLVSGAMFASDITSFSGDVALSHIRAGVTGGGSLVTSGAGDSVLAATLWLDEPNITLTPSDAMATAATLYISGAPTEGSSANYALFIDNGDARFDGSVAMFANSSFPNPANTFTFGSGVAQTHTHVAVIGAFTSSGISNHAERVFIGGSVTGFSGDTVSLAGLNVDATITTQGATQVIADVAQVRINEPGITVGTGDTITNAQSLLIVAAPTEGTNNYAIRVVAGDVIFGGNLIVSGAGPHAIGGAPSGIIGLIISDTFTSDGSGALASGIFVTQTLVGASGDTTSLTGVTFISAITTQTETESIANISQVEINEPFITDNLTGTISSAQSLLITGAPTEGSQNWALKILSGDVNLGGDLIDIGTGGGDIDILFRGCSTFFLGTLASPEEMLFGVGSTVSTAGAAMSLAQNVRFRLASTVGDFMEVKRTQVNFALSSGSSVTVASIPAGSFVVGITARVTTAVTGPTGFDIGDGVDVDRWGNSIAVALGTTVDITDYTASELSLFPTISDIVITSDGVDFTGGVVRIVVHHMSLSAPTS